MQGTHSPLFFGPQMNPVHKVFGPPGSGKTTYLLGLAESKLEEGVAANSIGYFAFTRKAASEAKDRAIKKFPHLKGEIDFPWFRTLHSLAYRCLGLSGKDVMKPEHYREFAREVGLDMSIDTGEEDFVIRTDNPILNEINIARVRGTDLKTHYNCSALKIEWHHFEYVERAYRNYKESKNLLDFTDMLEHVVREPEYLPRLGVLIIDEAQDLSQLQWQLVFELIRRADQTYIAGDDDQAVYVWAGADVQTFLGIEGEIKILEKSYRVPALIHSLANRVVNRIRTRQDKTWSPREEAGVLKTYDRFESVDLTSGEWLILASTNYMLNDLHEWIKSQGLLFERYGQRSVSEKTLIAVMGWETLRKGKEIDSQTVETVYKHLGTEFVKRGHKSLKTLDPEKLYTIDMLEADHGLLTRDIWHEVLTKISENQRSYIISLLRRGVKLTGDVPIRLSTIHGAKGGEADNVLLITDLSPKFANEYAKNSDDINRLLYVGITRARQSLHIILPKNEQKGFRF